MAFKTFEECRQVNITAARHLKRPCLRASISPLPVSSLSPSMCFQDCAVEPPPHPSTKTALLQSLIDYQYISFMTNAVGESLCLNDSYHNITYEHKYDCQYSTIPCGTSTQCNRRTLFYDSITLIHTCLTVDTSVPNGACAYISVRFIRTCPAIFAWEALAFDYVYSKTHAYIACFYANIAQTSYTYE